jgi:hypothetical protein
MNRPFRLAAALALLAAAQTGVAGTVTLTPTSLLATTQVTLPGGSSTKENESDMPRARVSSQGDDPNLNWSIQATVDTGGFIYTVSRAKEWAAGIDGQGALDATARATTRFTIPAGQEGRLDISFLVDDLTLYVDGDHGGTGAPAVNPFDDINAGTVGARFEYKVLLSADGVPETLYRAFAEIWGHGDYWEDNYTKRVLRNYEWSVEGLVDTRVFDRGNSEYGFVGKLLQTGDLKISKGKVGLVPGVEYKLDVVMSTGVRLRAFENSAEATIRDPNGLNNFTATLTTFDVNGGTVPVPGTVPLVLAGLLAAGLRARRRPGASGC